MKMSELTYSLQDLYDDVETFNKAAGKDTAKTKQDLLNQLRLVQEELNETLFGVENDDPVEALDGAIDTAVTLFGFIKQLENLGANVSAAACATAYNNMSKFTNYDIATETVNTLRRDNPDQVFAAEPFFLTPDSVVWVIKDGYNKVRKPTNYKKNEISQFAGKLPKE